MFIELVVPEEQGTRDLQFHFVKTMKENISEIFKKLLEKIFQSLKIIRTR
jgi:hypothetical protein